MCFWAKASLFKNPIARAILSSSGSIPVQRHEGLNNTNGSGNNANGYGGISDSSAKDTHFSLFRETFRALDAGEVIGLFPEGTSYTEPQIVQVKDGAAWSALEYSRWQLQLDPNGKENGAKKLVVIPVGVVYGDKARFQSRVSQIRGAAFFIVC